MLARYIRVICGETLCSWDEMKRFCSFGSKFLPPDIAQQVPPQVRWLAEHALSAKTYSYPNLLWTFSANKCQDPQDKVYRLQGLIRPKNRIEIGYSIPEEIFLTAAWAMMKDWRNTPRKLHRN